MQAKQQPMTLGKFIGGRVQEWVKSWWGFSPWENYVNFSRLVCLYCLNNLHVFQKIHSIFMLFANKVCIHKIIVLSCL